MSAKRTRAEKCELAIVKNGKNCSSTLCEWVCERVCVCVCYLVLCCRDKKPENLQQTSQWTEEPSGSDPVLQDLNTQNWSVGSTSNGWSTSNSWSTHTHTCVDGVGVRVQVRGQSQTEEHWEPENKKISGRVQIHQLQVRQANSSDHTWETPTHLDYYYITNTPVLTHITCDCDSPNSVQNIPPRIGSGSEANRAVNFPTDPNRNMIPAPYCTTRLLPTCTQGQQCKHETHYELIAENTSVLQTLGMQGWVQF